RLCRLRGAPERRAAGPQGAGPQGTSPPGGRATRCNSSAILGSRHSLEPLNSMRRKEMTTTIERPQLTADEIATRWLQDFESALSRRDIPAAAGLFAAASYWRDLVSFTWNLKTVENPDGVTDLLSHNLDRVSPADFELSEPAATADGVTEAWFTFTTSVGRGKGLVRLIDEDGTKA